MKTFFSHVALGGSIVVTEAARFDYTPGYVSNKFGTTVATFSNDDSGKFAYELFKTGLHRYADGSLFNEETQQFDIGTIDQLDIAPAAA